MGMSWKQAGHFLKAKPLPVMYWCYVACLWCAGCHGTEGELSSCTEAGMLDIGLSDGNRSRATGSQYHKSSECSLHQSPPRGGGSPRRGRSVGTEISASSRALTAICRKPGPSEGRSSRHTLLPRSMQRRLNFPVGHVRFMRT